MKLTLPVEKGYGRNLIYSGVLQLFSLLVSSMTMDGGQLGQWVAYSVGTYLAMALIIMARRPKQPTRGDLIAIKYGFVFILIWVVFLTSAKWAWERASQ
jgi:hypothetical protein